MALTDATTLLFLFVAWVGFGDMRHVYAVLGTGLTLSVGLIANTLLLRSPYPHLLIVVPIIRFTGPMAVLLAWYATHGVDLASVMTDLCFAAFLAFMVVLSVAEVRQADLSALKRELYKQGGLRKTSDGVIEFRLRGTSREGPHGTYFRPFRFAAWLDIAFALRFGAVFIFLVPAAFSSFSAGAITPSAWVFVIMFTGSGWLLRSAFAGVVVNWRLLGALERTRPEL